MAIVRAIPRSSFALILSALIIAASISFAAVYTARGENHDQTFYACLYAGSFSQINTSGPPANCGRGTQVQWNSQGIAGLPGVDGVSGYELSNNGPATELAPGEADSVYHRCPEGKVLLGGGPIVHDWDGDIADVRVIVEETSPFNTIDWRAYVRNVGPANVSVRVDITCAVMAPAAP